MVPRGPMGFVRKSHNPNVVSNISKDASLYTLSIRAKERLLEGNYMEAENCYSRAIAKIERSTTNAASRRLLEMLEGRANSREHMSRVEDALEDANRMLRTDPIDPRGYICLGHLLEAKNDLQFAMDCYKNGLTRCIQTCKDFKELVSAHNALSKALSEIEDGKLKRDPFSSFPHEIISLILSELHFQDILKCHRVSRRWRTILTSDHSLYKCIDLTFPSIKIELWHLRALLRYSGGDIRKLTIHQPEKNFSYNVFKGYNNFPPTLNYGTQRPTNQLGPLFKNLEHIKVRRGYLRERANMDSLFAVPYFPPATLRHANIEPYMSIDQIEDLCSAAPNLERLGCSIKATSSVNDSLRQFPTLKILLCRIIQPLRQSEYSNFLRWFPRVEDLTINQEAEDSANVRPHGVQSIFELPWKSLKAVRLREVSFVSSLKIASDILTVLELHGLQDLKYLEILPQTSLKELTINSTLQLNPEVLALFRGSCNTLTKLTISTPQFESQHIEYFLREGFKLRYLNINSLRNVNDGTLNLLQQLRSLEQLHVDYCTDVTRLGLMEFVKSFSLKRCGRMFTISIKGHQSIDEHIMDWARDLGVRISIYFPRFISQYQ